MGKRSGKVENLKKESLEQEDRGKGKIPRAKPAYGPPPQNNALRRISTLPAAERVLRRLAVQALPLK